MSAIPLDFDEDLRRHATQSVPSSIAVNSSTYATIDVRDKLDLQTARALSQEDEETTIDLRGYTVVRNPAAFRASNDYITVYKSGAQPVVGRAVGVRVRPGIFSSDIEVIEAAETHYVPKGSAISKGRWRLVERVRIGDVVSVHQTSTTAALPVGSSDYLVVKDSVSIAEAQIRDVAEHYPDHVDEAPAPSAIDAAIQFVRGAIKAGMHPPRTYALPEGGLMLRFGDNQRFASAHLFNDEEYFLGMGGRNTLTQSIPFNRNEIAAAISVLQDHLRG